MHGQTSKINKFVITVKPNHSDHTPAGRRIYSRISALDVEVKGLVAGSAFNARLYKSVANHP